MFLKNALTPLWRSIVCTSWHESNRGAAKQAEIIHGRTAPLLMIAPLSPGLTSLPVTAPNTLFKVRWQNSGKLKNIKVNILGMSLQCKMRQVWLLLTVGKMSVPLDIVQSWVVKLGLWVRSRLEILHWWLCYAKEIVGYFCTLGCYILTVLFHFYKWIDMFQM